MKLRRSILVHLAVLVVLAPFVLAGYRPLSAPPKTIPEDKAIPDVTYPPFDPEIDHAVAPLDHASAEDGDFVLPRLGTRQPLPAHVDPGQPGVQPIVASPASTAQVAKPANQKPWWQRWKLPGSTGAQVGPDAGMRAVQPNEAAAAAAASTENGVRPSTTIVKNSVSQGSWLPQWKWPWTRPLQPAPISTTNQLKLWLRQGASAPPVTEERPVVNIVSVANGYPAVQLPGNAWDGRVVNAMKQRGEPFFVRGSDRMWLVGKGKTVEVSPQDMVSFTSAMQKSQDDATELTRLDLTPQAASRGVRNASTMGGYWSRVAQSAKGALGGVRSSFFRYMHGV
ncbi:uncharacterized protein SPSC_05105 [Sporisorium scitamineum]|uniref:Secreted protein n=1 Tax=Sporisorium scitamineum TaxID=49012 RepID=A0A0F7S296_9BASI|nr:hypothetical protein [Sporisorium scitamineum]CDU25271.1 uncharacterized protein SPSC_05105 [Sporisorium scitamineum]